MTTKVKAGNLHYPNDEEMAQVTPSADVTNNQSALQLEDPEDKTGSGNLHFPNLEETGPDAEAETPVKEAVTAAARIAQVMKAKAKSATASTCEPGAVGPAEAEDEGGNGNNVATLGNGVEAPAPTDGYVEVKEGDVQPAVTAAAEDEDADEDDGMDDDDESDEAAVKAAFGKFGATAGADDTDELEIPDGNAPQQQIEIGADVDEDWDPNPEDEGEDLEIVDDEEPALEGDDLIDLEGEGEAEDFGDDFAEPENVAAGGDADVMDLVDVDGTEDNGDDMAFATVANVIHVLKANRVVASMGKKHATKANVSDVYLSDEFADVVEAEVKRHGLRAGLKGMGFVMARVNVTASKVINKRLEAKTKKIQASVRAEKAEYDKVLEQSLAIAAVGMNRQYFKGVKNPLKAALVERLEQAGVRNANRMVASVFAQEGVQYTKEALALAKRLVAMPQPTRNSFAAALDMTSDDVVDDDETSETLLEGDDDTDAEDFNQFDEEFIDDIEAPTSVEAALTRPIHRKERVAASAKPRDPGALLNASAVPRQQATKLSAAARAVLLDGDLYAGN